MEDAPITNWAKPTGVDLLEVLAIEVFNKCDANVVAGAQVADPKDETKPLRSDLQVAQCVQQVRAAIQAAGRFPLSVDPFGVPNGARAHVLSLAAWNLVCSTPSLQMTVVTEKGVYSPLGDAAKSAKAYIDDLMKGLVVDIPSDPTGRDYSTAVSDSNPLPCLVKWRDTNGADADYARGYKVSPYSGAAVALPVDDMTTN